MIVQLKYLMLHHVHMSKLYLVTRTVSLIYRASEERLPLLQGLVIEQCVIGRLRMKLNSYFDLGKQQKTNNTTFLMNLQNPKATIQKNYTWKEVQTVFPWLMIIIFFQVVIVGSYILLLMPSLLIKSKRILLLEQYLYGTPQRRKLYLAIFMRMVLMTPLKILLEHYIILDG